MAMVPSACFLCPAYGTSGRGDEPHPYFYATVPKICSPCVQKVKCLREAFRIRASDGRVRSCPTVWPLDVPYVHEIGGPHRVGRESGAKETICGLCAQRLGDEDDVRHCGAGSCPLVFHTGCLAMASLEGALLAGSGNLCPFCDGAIIVEPRDRLRMFSPWESVRKQLQVQSRASSSSATAACTSSTAVVELSGSTAVVAPPSVVVPPVSVAPAAPAAILPARDIQYVPRPPPVTRPSIGKKTLKNRKFQKSQRVMHRFKNGCFYGGYVKATKHREELNGDMRLT